ncbi:MAG: SusC/RagA family TonB-linked outer membrane protein [Bacteroidetes bacterium]|nr:MAG: SusC/RagA family TonB-linked outer membrane protein [Bacteroidota bacterium]
MRKLFFLTVWAMLLSLQSLRAQTTDVVGKVTDANGNPIPGVSVIEKGTHTGTTTASDGTYAIKVKPNGVLVFSGVGFETKEVKATGGVHNVQLGSDTRSLSEVVVTGVGVATSKRKLGISVESIAGDKLPQTPTASIDQAIIGKIPGAQISSVSGNPGDKVNIVLRGINTVQGGTRPLVMLDGVEVPFESLTTLDLGQVERMEVVQGAASASLYGAQGANGVIQIFTKRGSKGRLAINVSSSIASNKFINAGDFGKADKHPYLTDASGNIVNAGSNASIGYNAGDPVTIDPVTGSILGSNSIAYQYGANVPGLPGAIPGLTDNYTRYGILDPRNNYDKPYVGNLHYYDHFAQVFTGANTYNNSVSVSGGSDKMDFNFAFANNYTNSPFLKDNGFMSRSNVTVNLGFEVFKNFTIRSITNLVYTYNNMHPQLGAPGGPGYGLGNSNADVGGVYGFLNTSPFFSLQDTITGGHYASYQRASFLSVNAFNPYYRLEYNAGNSKRYDIIQNIEANYKVNKYVTLNAKYGISYKNENDVWTYYNQTQNANTEYYTSYVSYYSPDETGEIDNWQYNNTKQNFLGSATIHFDFDKDFHLNLPIQSNTLAAFDYRRNDYKELDMWGQTLLLAPPFNLLATQGQNVANDYVQPFVTYGYLVDQRFDFGSYGGITGGFRTDYSSAFGAGSKPFTFPHGNAYVNLNSFGFWNGIESLIPHLKIRAAYGKAGIQPGPFDRYPVLNLQPMGNELVYTNKPNARNPDLNVEVSTEKEIGTDFTFNLFKGDWLKNLNVSFTYWKRHTDNAIFDQNVPPSTGASTLKTNAIALSSNGWQAGVTIPILSSRSISWDFTFNVGHQTSVIDNVAGGDIPLTTAAGSTGLVLAAGRKIGEIYGYKALTSVSQVRGDGKTPFIDPADQGNYEIVNGRVVNKTTKAIFFSDEAESLGDPNPKLTSSFINAITWKNTITFGFQFDWIDGSHLYNQTNEWMYRDGISKDFTTPVTINGETGAWGAYYASAYYALGNTAKGVGNNVTKDYFYHDASFVRLRNISLGVDLARFANKQWLKRCQVVLSGRNLFTWTKYPGMDPEISSGASNSAFDRGIDHSTIPNMKSYQLTLNLGF